MGWSEALSGFTGWWRRHPRSHSLGIAGAFGIGLWVAATTLAYADYYAYREPGGVHGAHLLRRLYVNHLAQAPYAMAPVLSLDELRVLQGAPGRWHAEGYALRMAQVRVGEAARTLTVAVATDGFLPQLGVRLLAGTFAPVADMPTATQTALISEHLWREAFDNATDVLGAAIQVDGRPYTIAGILAGDFSGIDRHPTDVWIPLDPLHATPGSVPGAHFLSAVVRVPAATNDGAATRDMLRLLESQRPAHVSSVALRPLASDRYGEDAARRLAPYALLAAAAVLLLALCNCFFLLAAGLKENLAQLRIRSALGASPAQLWLTLLEVPVLVMLVTSLFVAATLPVSLHVVRLTGAEVPHDLAAWRSLPTLALVGGVAIALVLSALVLAHRHDIVAPGVAPFRRAAAGHRFRNALAFCYLTISAALAVGLVPIARSWSRVIRSDPGFDPREALAIRVDLGPVPRDRANVGALRRVLDEIARVPAVRAAAVSTSLPFGATLTAPVVVDAATQRTATVHLYLALGDVVGALGLRVASGDTTGMGVPGSRLAMVNEVAAGQLAVPPLGACLLLHDNACRVVTAVAHNGDVVTLGEDPRPVLYATLDDQTQPSIVYLIVRTRGGDSGPAIRAIEGLARRSLPGASLQPTTLTDWVERQRAPARRLARAGVLLLAIGCALALGGLRATVVLELDARAQDLGIRMALGASRIRVFLSACRDLFRVSLLSLVAGGFMGVLLIRMLSSRVPDLSPAAWPDIVLAAAILPAAFVIGAVVPAWRFACAQPARILVPDARSAHLRLRNGGTAPGADQE